jgi:hypothetical protein
MPSEAKLIANKNNASRSTGPLTSQGKLRSKENALTHGLFSVSPNLPGERPEPWKRFRSAVLTDINPVGAIELALAEKLTLNLWKQKRLSAHEVAVASERIIQRETNHPALRAKYRRLEKEMEDAVKRKQYWQAKQMHVKLLEQSPDTRVDDNDASNFFVAVADALELKFDPYDKDFLKLYDNELQGIGDEDPYDGVIQWNVALILKGVSYLVQPGGKTVEHVVKLLLEEANYNSTECEKGIVKLRVEIRKEAGNYEQHIAIHAMPDEASLNTLMRYESHLQRQITTTLHELQRLQAGRLNGTANVPVAIDISLTGDCQDRRTDRLLDEEQGNSFIGRPLKQIEAIAQPMGC